MTIVAAVLVLGGIGAIWRALLSRWMPPLVGTLLVNVSAAFLLGLSIRWTGWAATGFRIGLLGAASTWSTLANESATLLRERQVVRAALYLAVSLAAGVAAAWWGLQLSDS